MPGSQDEIANDPWIYIGTTDVDNANDQLNGNPAPFNPDIIGTPAPGYQSPPYNPGDIVVPYVNIPFQNGWTNLGSGFSPVCFMVTVENYLEIHGAFTGGADGSVVFTLPDLSGITPTPPVPPSTGFPPYWAPTPNADPTLLGSYWPTVPKVLVGSFADGSGTFTFSIGTNGDVTYITGATF